MKNREMKAAILKDLKKIEVKEVEKPKISEGKVLVRVKSCAICAIMNLPVQEAHHISWKVFKLNFFDFL